MGFCLFSYLTALYVGVFFVKGGIQMDEKDEKKLEEYEKKEKMQKNTAKFWLSIIGIVVLVAIVWAIASHL